MSNQTRDDIDAAIRAHIADEYPGSLVGSYIVILEQVPETDDRMTHVVDVVPHGQSNVTSLGLAWFLANARLPHTNS